MNNIPENLEKFGFDKRLLETVDIKNPEQFGVATGSGGVFSSGHQEPGLTYCILGSSGVGKTTLINKLIGESTYKTKAVSKKESKGRHITTHRQLIKLDSGAMVVDTPGMRELGNIAVETGIEETFFEIIALSEKCHFNNCTHVEEKGCAVLDAVDKGLLSIDRYHNYIKMNKESTYNEISYLEKRKKDKQFGKLCKSVMKHKKSQNER